MGVVGSLVVFSGEGQVLGKASVLYSFVYKLPKYEPCQLLLEFCGGKREQETWVVLTRKGFQFLSIIGVFFVL